MPRRTTLVGRVSSRRDVADRRRGCVFAHAASRGAPRRRACASCSPLSDARCARARAREGGDLSRRCSRSIPEIAGFDARSRGEREPHGVASRARLPAIATTSRSRSARLEERSSTSRVGAARVARCSASASTPPRMRIVTRSIECIVSRRSLGFDCAPPGCAPSRRSTARLLGRRWTVPRAVHADRDLARIVDCASATRSTPDDRHRAAARRTARREPDHRRAPRASWRRCARSGNAYPERFPPRRARRPTCTRTTTRKTNEELEPQAHRGRRRRPHDAEARDGQGELRDAAGHVAGASSSTSRTTASARRRSRRSSTGTWATSSARRARCSRPGPASCRSSATQLRLLVEGAAAAAGEIPRPDRPGAALPAALRRPHHQSGSRATCSSSARRSCRRSASSSSRAATSKSRRR